MERKHDISNNGNLHFACVLRHISWQKLQQKKQGIQTDVLGKGKTGFVRFIEVGLKCLSYVMPAAEVAAIVLGVNTAPTAVRAVGFLLAVAGDAVFILAVVTMRDSWRAGVPEKEETTLVTSGIFRYSRNPAFLGFDMVYVGILLMFFSPWLLALTAVTVLFFHLQIVNVEEDFLLQSFGEEYLAYRKKVNRYIGRR